MESDIDQNVTTVTAAPTLTNDDRMLPADFSTRAYPKAIAFAESLQKRGGRRTSRTIPCTRICCARCRTSSGARRRRWD
jgi:hypothetical protein